MAEYDNVEPVLPGKRPLELNMWDDGENVQPQLPQPAPTDPNEVYAQQQEALGQHAQYAQMLQEQQAQAEARGVDLDVAERMSRILDTQLPKPFRDFEFRGLARHLGIDPASTSVKELSKLLLGLDPDSSFAVKQAFVEKVQDATPGQVSAFAREVLIGRIPPSVLAGEVMKSGQAKLQKVSAPQGEAPAQEQPEGRPSATEQEAPRSIGTGKNGGVTLQDFQEHYGAFNHILDGWLKDQVDMFEYWFTQPPGTPGMWPEKRGMSPKDARKAAIEIWRNATKEGLTGYDLDPDEDMIPPTWDEDRRKQYWNKNMALEYMFNRDRFTDDDVKYLDDLVPRIQTPMPNKGKGKRSEGQARIMQAQAGGDDEGERVDPKYKDKSVMVPELSNRLGFGRAITNDAAIAKGYRGSTRELDQRSMLKKRQEQEDERFRLLDRFIAIQQMEAGDPRVSPTPELGVGPVTGRLPTRYQALRFFYNNTPDAIKDKLYKLNDKLYDKPYEDKGPKTGGTMEEGDRPLSAREAFLIRNFGKELTEKQIQHGAREMEARDLAERTDRVEGFLAGMRFDLGRALNEARPGGLSNIEGADLLQAIITADPTSRVKLMKDRAQELFNEDNWQGGIPYNLKAISTERLENWITSDIAPPNIIKMAQEELASRHRKKK